MFRKIIISALTGLVVVGANAKTESLATHESVVLRPEPYMAEASKWATTFLTRAHYKKTQLDDKMSAQILDRYIESLDPNRVFFLDSDIRGFESYRSQLDDALLDQDLQPAFTVFNVYSHRVRQRIEHANKLLDQGLFDFTVDETLELDRSESPWAKSEAELDQIWRKRVKNDYLRLHLTEKEASEIVKTLSSRYNNLGRRISELDGQDVFQYFMNAYAASIEPHTSYLAPRTSENFNISMRLSLEGIGAVLQRDTEYTIIRRIVPGGPADQNGKLQEGDRIVSVAQGTEEPVDVIGWRLDDVVEMIRGPAGSEVRLGVIPADMPISAKAETLALIREKVKLEEQAAQNNVFELNENGETTRIGVIDLPTFYLDFAARARREPNYRSSTRDVRNLIDELKKANVDGIVIDLRNNGGGSLAEATELAGLFIDKGPVVQVKDSSGRVDIESDTEAGIIWDGPLAVLVNRNSASASEIFAAAIQDYGRGIVVGEPTFGKGTVQNLINLDRYGRSDSSQFGQLKLTMAQFFRINGGSTQHRGVIPDVIFPIEDRDEKRGESAFENALPWTSIKPARYQIHDDLTGILPLLDERSGERLKNNPDFKFLLEDIKSFREAQEKTQVSLLEASRREELETLDEKRLARKAERDSWSTQALGATILDISEAQPLQPAGLDTDEEIEQDDPADPESGDNDVLLDETLRIIGDLIRMTGDDADVRTAQTGVTKDSKSLN